MLRSVVAASIKFRLLVVTLAAGVIALGVAVLPNAPVDVLPEFSPPFVEIQTEALGLSPAEVEQLITVPLEADLLNGVQGVDIIRSTSVAGLSSIVMVFEPETDLYLARARVEERMTQAHALPQVSKPPTMLQPLSSSSRLLMVSLASDTMTPVERSVLARWTVRPRLMGVPGVANVAIWGQRERQLQVQVDPQTLHEKGITLQQVVNTTGNAQIVSPLSFLEASTPGTGGFIETAQQRLQVRHVFDSLATPTELGKVPVDGTQGRVLLSDVATIVEDHQPLIGDAIVSDRGEGLLLVVEKFPGASTVEVTEAVEDALEKLQPALSGIRVDTSLFRPAGFIADGLVNLRLAVLIGAGLLLLGLAAWFRQWRTVLVAVTCLPVALTGAALVLHLRHAPFNAISFAGLAAAAVVVVDDAVSGADGVARRIDVEGRSAAGRDLAEAFVGSRGPLGYAVLIGLLSVIPVVVMEGRPGAFFAPVATSYAFAVVASLVVAVTLAPALSSLIFSRTPSKGAVRGQPRLTGRYVGLLERGARSPRRPMVVAGAGALFTLIALPLANLSVVPEFKDRDVLVRLDGAAGMSQPAMTETVSSVSKQLRAIDGVGSVAAHVGRAVTGDQIVDVNSSELWLRIRPDSDYEKCLAAIEQVAAGLTGFGHDVVSYTGGRIRDIGALRHGVEVKTGDLDILTGSSHPLTVRVYGEDLTVMRQKAEEIRVVMAGVTGVVDPKTLEPLTQDVLEVEVDLAKAAKLGIKPGDVRRAEATLIQGIQVGSIFEGQKVFDVVVQGSPASRQSVDSVRGLLIDTPSGGQVRLEDIANVRVRPVPTAIERDAVARRMDVVADVRGTSLDTVASDVEKAIAGISFPLEHHAEVFTITTNDEIDLPRVIGFGVGVVIAVVLLLQAAFRSWRLGLLAFLTILASLSGGVLVALLIDLSLAALAALLGVLGLATRNALLLFREAQELEAEATQPDETAAARSAAAGRLTGVTGTAVSLALAALPFAVMGPVAGLEIIQPMSLVLLGGLVTATFTALFVLPALYGRVRAGSPEHEPAVTAEAALEREYV